MVERMPETGNTRYRNGGLEAAIGLIDFAVVRVVVVAAVG
jgi:hypothetical protein